MKYLATRIYKKEKLYLDIESEYVVLSDKTIIQAKITFPGRCQ